MRYKMNKPALLRKMAEYGQTIEQRIAYMQHNISVLMEKHVFYIIKGYKITTSPQKKYS